MTRSNTEPRTQELRLLLLCARLDSRTGDDAAIVGMLEDGIDWTAFVRAAVHHDMAGIAGATLLRVGAASMPREIAEALRLHIEQKVRSSSAALSELSRISKALAEAGLDAIVLRGPALALRLDERPCLREFRELDFLVREEHRKQAADVLLELGYHRRSARPPAQTQTEFLYSEAAGLGAKLHTRLTSIGIALDIDYRALWRRSERITRHGRPALLLEAEDDLLALAIHGSRQLWWNLTRVRDVALLVAAHASLDWSAVLARAKAQGCSRMVLLAVSLAARCFRLAPPESLRKHIEADAHIEALTSRCLASWESERPAAPPSAHRLSPDLLMLHDGLTRRARYLESIALASLSIRARRVLALVQSSKDSRFKRRRCEQAQRRARRALAENSQDAGAWCELGDALAGLERHAEAIECYEKALAVEPDDVRIWRSRSEALASLGKDLWSEERLAEPTDAGSWAVRAGLLFARRKFNEAAAASDRALELEPDHANATRIGIHSRLSACEWSRREADVEQLLAGIRQGRAVARPIEFRRMCASERENFLAAQVWARAFPASAEPLYSGERYSHDKTRIAYISSDLRDHVVAETIVGCFERHDRTRFETTAISLLEGDGSALRRRVERAFDRFIDVNELDDIGVARRIRALEIDVLIDLNGYAGTHHRPGILAHRPAPVQVSYLGFPGTTAAPFMDYIIADRFVIPEENRRYYTEKVVRLPHSYMPSDDRRARSEKTWTRTEAGLPEGAFVFACHHDERKLGPEMFRLWMRLLQSIEGSVLWLKSANSSAVANLRREAAACQIAPERLIFAPRLERSEDHLARLGLADLFLDTLPYNAHATAWDALWAGLPLITCRGEGYPGLVASSILQASGLPELITASLAEYEALAATLARSPAHLLSIRARLARERESAPFFDTAGHTRYLESAYARMCERHQAGLPPADFDVPARSDARPFVAAIGQAGEAACAECAPLPVGERSER